MKKLLFAFAAVLLGSGAALADSAPSMVVMNPHHVTYNKVGQALVTGDTAPKVEIVKHPRLDRSGAAAMRAPHHTQRYNSRQGDAAPPLR